MSAVVLVAPAQAGAARGTRAVQFLAAPAFAGATGQSA